MAIRVRLNVEYAISSSPAESEDLGKRQFHIRTDGMNEGGSLKTVIPDGSTDLETIIPHVAAVGLIMIQTAPVDVNDVTGKSLTVKLEDAANDAIVIDPIPGKREGIFLLTTSALSKVYFTNASGFAIEIIIAFAGD